MHAACVADDEHHVIAGHHLILAKVYIIDDVDARLELGLTIDIDVGVSAGFGPCDTV